MTVQAQLKDIICHISFIYASTYCVSRRRLWSDLISLASNISGPLLLARDFNATLGAHEQHGGGMPGSVSCAAFRNFIDDCILTQLPMNGHRFSWARDRDNLGHMERNLDRALGNPSWFDAWSSTNYQVLPRTVSDHSPLVISCFISDANFPKPFHFQSTWLHHADFRRLVSDVWGSVPTHGCPMFMAVKKLKVLKTRLRVWNKLVFRNGHDSV